VRTRLSSLLVASGTPRIRGTSISRAAGPGFAGVGVERGEGLAPEGSNMTEHSRTASLVPMWAACVPAPIRSCAGRAAISRGATPTLASARQ
jgi:hypothetical protein